MDFYRILETFVMLILAFYVRSYAIFVSRVY